MGGDLLQWVIYWNPRDFPGCWVTRRWTTSDSGLTPDLVAAYVGNSLDGARSVVPDDSILVPAFLDDDPAIVEVWL